MTPSLEAVADDGRRALVFAPRVMAGSARHRDAGDDVELGVGRDVGALDAAAPTEEVRGADLKRAIGIGTRLAQRARLAPGMEASSPYCS